MVADGSDDPSQEDRSPDGHLAGERGAFDLRKFSGEAALVIIAAGIGNAFSYVFHFVISRKLGPSAYGTLVTMTSIAAIAGVVGNSLGTVAMQETARLWATHLDAAIAPLIRRTLRFVLAIAAAIALCVILGSVLLSSYLHVAQPRLWLALAVFIAVAIVTAFARGAAQGAHRFWVFAASFVSEGAVKVAMGVWLVALGFGVAGAMGGLIASTAIACAIALPASIVGGGAGPGQPVDARYLGRAALLVFGVTATTNALLFIDMLFAKHHFSGEAAGYFGAAGTIARTIPFGASFFALILMPKAAAARHAGPGSSVRVLALAAGMTAVAVALGLAFICLLPSSIVGVTYGPAFGGAVPIVRAYALDEALFALWAAASAYLVAVGRYEVFAYLAAATTIEAVGMALVGSTPLRLLSVGICVNAALVPTVWLLALRSVRITPQAGSPQRAESAP